MEEDVYDEKSRLLGSGSSRPDFDTRRLIKGEVFFQNDGIYSPFFEKTNNLKKKNLEKIQFWRRIFFKPKKQRKKRKEKIGKKSDFPKSFPSKISKWFIE